MIVVLMGVSGSGKTTLGTRVADQLGWEFADADDFHPAANVAKMRAGIPLTDADRAPWLATLHGIIARWIGDGKSTVLAFSALKQEYREELRVGPEVRFVYLKASPEVLRQRLKARSSHYMKAGMLESQLETLEEPQDTVVVDVSGTVEESVQAVLGGIERSGNRSIG